MPRKPAAKVPAPSQITARLYLSDVGKKCAQERVVVELMNGRAAMRALISLRSDLEKMQDKLDELSANLSYLTSVILALDTEHRSGQSRSYN